MRTQKPNPNLKRLQRIILWATLWLAWAGEFVAGAARRFRATRFLETPAFAAFFLRVADIVGMLILIEAMQIVGRRVANNGRFVSRAQIKRAFLGGAFRRLLRGGDLAERIAKLAHVLRNRASIAARLARRIARGLTQAHIFTAHCEIALTLPAFAHAPACRDSS